MNLGETLFINHYPKIDLHGMTSDIARVMVNDFIKDNIKLKNEFIVIIHGKGNGILSSVVLETVKKNKFVSEYALKYDNTGCMIVKLKISE